MVLLKSLMCVLLINILKAGPPWYVFVNVVVFSNLVTLSLLLCVSQVATSMLSCCWQDTHRGLTKTYSMRFCNRPCELTTQLKVISCLAYTGRRIDCLCAIIIQAILYYVREFLSNWPLVKRNCYCNGSRAVGLGVARGATPTSYLWLADKPPTENRKKP